MVRQGICYNSEQFYRSEQRICKTPRIVLERLNIPLDGVVLVKGDSIIYPLDSASGEKNNIIDVSSDDDVISISEDEDFQKIVQRFQSTRENTVIKKGGTSDIKFQHSTSLITNSRVNRKPGPRSKRTLVSKPKFSDLTSMQTPVILSKDFVKTDHKTNDKLECDKRLSSSENEAPHHIMNPDDTELSKVNDTKDEERAEESLSKSNSKISNVKKKKSLNDSTAVKKKKEVIISNKKSSDDETYVAIKKNSPPDNEGNELGNEKEDLETKIDATPSRISQRIKNKKVKFSARQLLTAGDVFTLKKELKNSMSKKKRSPIKKLPNKIKIDSASDINANDDSNSSQIVSKEPTKVVLQTKQVENTENFKKKEDKTNEVNQVKRYNQTSLINKQNKVNSSRKTVDTANSNPIKDSSALETGSEDVGDVMKPLSDKIKLKLKENQPKKVINISLPPLKETIKIQEKRMENLKQNLDHELGPDIVIRRVKNEKTSTGSKNEENKNVSTTPISKPQESNVEVKATKSSLSVKNITNPIQEIEIPPQIKKLILEASKNRKSITFKPSESLMTKINSISNNKISNDTGLINKKKKKFGVVKGKTQDTQNVTGKTKQSKNKNKDSDVPDSDDEIQEGNCSDDPVNVRLINRSVEEEDSYKETDGSNDTNRKSTKDLKNHKEDDADRYVERVGGKKTAKVTPLRQVEKVQTKNDLIKKNVNDRGKEVSNVPKSKTVPKLSSPGELIILGGKRNYKNAFEEHFISTKKICEHNESIDSDSNSDEIEVLSHFINLKSINKDVREEIKVIDLESSIDNEDISRRLENQEEGDENVDFAEVDVAIRTLEDNLSKVVDTIEKNSIIEMIKHVIVELPKWIYHTTPDTSVICLLLLERESNGILDVRKCIEIDNNYKVNVYVNKVLVNEYCGIYDNIDAIKNLIYQIDLL